MNNITKLSDYLRKDFKFDDVFENFSDKISSNMNEMATAPTSSTVKPMADSPMIDPQTNAAENIPAQFRKYESSFPDRQFPPGTDDNKIYKTKRASFVDIRDYSDKEQDEHLSTPDVPQRAGGIIINENGQVLIRQPANNDDNTWGNDWTFSKGHIDEGESSAQAALREVEEETGMKCKILRPITGTYDKHTKEAGISDSTKFFLMQVESTGDHGEETQAVQWVTPQEAINKFKGGGDKYSAHRDIEALHMALHTRHKMQNVETVLDTGTESFLDKFKSIQQEGVDNLADFMDQYLDKIIDTGEIPDDFLTNDRFRELRTKMRTAFLHTTATDTANIGGITKSQMAKIGRAVLNDITEFGEVTSNVDLGMGVTIFGSGDKTWPDAFDYAWREAYQGAHNNSTNDILQEVIGELFGISDTYSTKVIGDMSPPDLDQSGNTIWRSYEERKALIKGYEAWQNGGPSKFKLPPRWNPITGHGEPGPDVDFEDESILAHPSALNAMQGDKPMQGWQLAAIRSRSRDIGRRALDPQLQQVFVKMGGSMLDKDGNSMSGKPAHQKIFRAKEMIKEMIFARQKLSQSMLEVLAPGSNFVVIHRGTTSATEVGGYKNAKGIPFGPKDLHDLGMPLVGDETEAGFPIKISSRPLTGGSINLQTPQAQGGNLTMTQKVHKSRIVHLPWDFSGHDGEKEISLIDDPNAPANLYHGQHPFTELQQSNMNHTGVIFKSNNLGVGRTGAGWHFIDDDGNYTAFGNSTPTPFESPWHGGVNDENELLDGSEAVRDHSEDYEHDGKGKLGTGMGAGVYTNKKTGKKYYVKVANEEQNAVEDLSNKIYKKANIPVAPTKLIPWKGGRALVSEWLDLHNDDDIKDGYHGYQGAHDAGNQPESLVGQDDLQQGILVDALLSNWDVSGAGPEKPFGNILQGKDKKFYRIDHGGSMYLTGLGQETSAKQNAFFNGDPGGSMGEITNFLDPNGVNPSAAHLFKGMHDHVGGSITNMATAIAKLNNVTDKSIMEMVDNSGIRHDRKDQVIATLIKRKIQIEDWTEENWPNALDQYNLMKPSGIYKSISSIGDLQQFIQKASDTYTPDPRVAWLKKNSNHLYYADNPENRDAHEGKFADKWNGMWSRVHDVQNKKQKK